MPEDTAVQSVKLTLTDGTGVSRLTQSKLIKDFVVDFLMTIPISLLAVNISSIPQDEAGLLAAFLGLGNALMGAGYRALLKWGQS